MAVLPDPGVFDDSALTFATFKAMDGPERGIDADRVV
jgi:hypothetical protein